MSSTLSPTLFYDLTSPRPGVTRLEYPATDLIYKLLHHIGEDVSSFRRNCQVSYRLVEYARDLYDEINSRISKAEESGCWEHYDAYNQAIGPLQEALLGIMEVTVVEREEYLISATLPELDEKDMETWIKQSVTDWLEHRRRIRACLDSLRTQEVFRGFIISPADYKNDIQHAKVHDDQTLLLNLLASIGENGSKIEKVKPQNAEMIRKVKDTLQSALEFLRGGPKKSLEEELIVLAIECAMIVYGVTEIMKLDEIKRHPALYDRVYGSRIWSTANSLVIKLHDHLKHNDAAPNLSLLRQMYVELEAALTGDVPALLPDEYHKLFPLVGRIGPAYYSQSLVLATLCKEIASHYMDNKIYEAHSSLEKALSKTIEAFIAAGELYKKPQGDVTCEQIYDESIGEIKSCFDVMKDLEVARAKDKGFVISSTSIFTNSMPSQEFIDMTLMILNEGGDGTISHALVTKVLPSARLSYVKRLSTSQFEGYEICHFEDPMTKLPIPLDMAVESLMKDGKCTLNVIVREKVQESQLDSQL